MILVMLYVLQCLNVRESLSLVSQLPLLIFNKGYDGDASADGFVVF